MRVPPILPAPDPGNAIGTIPDHREGVGTGVNGRPARAAALALCAALTAVFATGTPPYRAAAQSSANPAPQRPATIPSSEERLSQGQLEQLLAPIALHPDQLLAPILMAATYPLEIVQAKRWRDRNAALAGAALEQALLDQPWDASVKSLVPFPEVLTLMNDQLEWTQRLGDAMLDQQEDVLNAIQVLRGRAQAHGALQSGPQQTVTVTQTTLVPRSEGPAPVVAPPAQIITIAPTEPDVVYVPAYDPNLVYGSWPYPQSPPAYYPPPVGWGLGGALLTGMAFAGGAAIVGGLWGWSSPNWGGGNINVSADRVNNINRNVSRDRTNIGSGNRWQHDTTHRGGVAYRSEDVRNRYQGGREPQAAREQFRGRTENAGGARPEGSRPGQGQGQRPADGARPGGDRPSGDRPGGQRPDGERPGADRPGGERPGAGGANRPNAGHGQKPANPGASRPGSDRVNAGGRPQVSQQPASRGGAAFDGLGDGGRERAAAERGAASRQGSAQFQGGGRPAAGAAGGGGARAGGGGARAGGGGGRGGGGRR